MTLAPRVMAALMLAVPVLTACAPVYRNHGFVPPDTDLAQVAVGQTRVDQLEALLGRPSSQGVLTGAGWYYVGSRFRHYGPLEPQEISRQVVAVSFAPDGTVSNVERFGLEKGKVIVISRRVTDTQVTELGLVRQLLNSVGRVSAAQALAD